jgi:hypothetical protein
VNSNFKWSKQSEEITSPNKVPVFPSHSSNRGNQGDVSNNLSRNMDDEDEQIHDDIENLNSPAEEEMNLE